MLTDRLGLSATPVKAALAALEREGFATATPHRGFFVSEIGADDVRELYELRQIIDAIAARKSARASFPVACPPRSTEHAGIIAAIRDGDPRRGEAEARADTYASPPTPSTAPTCKVSATAQAARRPSRPERQADAFTRRASPR